MKYKMPVIYVVLVLLAFVALYFIGQKRKEKNQVISVEGVEAVGTVINRVIMRNPNMFESYTIKFDFEVDGELLQAVNTFNDRWYYENAIIGMKYQIKYLPKAPKRNVDIYINKPIKSEYVNIENERERIFETYEDAKGNLRKNARPLEKIKPLIQ